MSTPNNSLVKPSAGLTSAQRKSKELGQFLTANKDMIQQAAAVGVSVDRLIKTACLLALKKDFNGKDSSLLECSNASIMQAITECARIGIDPSFGRAYIIPYGGQANLQLGYLGLIELAKRSGSIKSITAEIVHSGDDFYVEQGSNPQFRHIPKFNSSGSDFVLVYAFAVFADGHFEYCVMRKEEIEAIRNSKKKKSGEIANSPAWDNYYTEMAKKVAIRRLCKTLPLTYEAQAAIENDDAHSNNDVLDVDVVVHKPMPKTPVQNLAPPKSPKPAAVNPAPAEDPFADDSMAANPEDEEDDNLKPYF